MDDGLDRDPVEHRMHTHHFNTAIFQKSEINVPLSGRVKVSLFASYWVCLSWLTLTAAFRRLHGLNCKVPVVKSCGRSAFHLLIKVLSNTVFIHFNPDWLYLFLFFSLFYLYIYIQKSFLPFHQPSWKILHSVQRILIQPISNCDTKLHRSWEWAALPSG